MVQLHFPSLGPYMDRLCTVVHSCAQTVRCAQTVHCLCTACVQTVHRLCRVCAQLCTRLYTPYTQLWFKIAPKSSRFVQNHQNLSQIIPNPRKFVQIRPKYPQSSQIRPKSSQIHPKTAILGQSFKVCSILAEKPKEMNILSKFIITK